MAAWTKASGREHDGVGRKVSMGRRMAASHRSLEFAISLADVTLSTHHRAAWCTSQPDLLVARLTLSVKRFPQRDPIGACLPGVAFRAGLSFRSFVIAKLVKIMMASHAVDHRRVFFMAENDNGSLMNAQLLALQFDVGVLGERGGREGQNQGKNNEPISKFHGLFPSGNVHRCVSGRSITPGPDGCAILRRPLLPLPQAGIFPG